MATTGTVGSVTTSLHPLVIMNISEHWTRTKAQAGKPQKVYGALIGNQKGRNIEVMNSFELDYTVLEDKVIIDRDYYNMKEEQFKQVKHQTSFRPYCHDKTNRGGSIRPDPDGRINRKPEGRKYHQNKLN